MKFNNHEIKLAIFDLDGTLIKSTSIWADIDKAFFHRRNMEIPPKYGIEIAHVGLKKAAEITRTKYLPNEKEKDIIKEWKSMCLEEYKYKIPLKENAKELLELLFNNNIPIALATANSKEIYEPCLIRLGIDQYFSLIIDVNSCKEGKNSPEIYDRIVDEFKVKREETIIFEDMIVPLKTAYKAGYKVVGVHDAESTKDEGMCINNCHLFIKNFQEIIDILKASIK